MNITKFYKDCNKRLIDAIYDTKRPTHIIVSEVWINNDRCKVYTIDKFTAFVMPPLQWYIDFGTYDKVRVDGILAPLFKPFTDAAVCKIGVRGYGVSGTRVLLDDIYEIDVKLIKQFGPIDEIELWRDTTSKSAIYYVTDGDKVLGIVMGVKPAKGSEQQ